MKKSKNKHNNSNNEFMTTEEAAKYLRLDPRTLRIYARQGKIPAHKPLGRWMFIKDELREWVKGRHRKRKKR